MPTHETTNGQLLLDDVERLGFRPTDRAIDGSDFLPALAGKKIDRKTA